MLFHFITSHLISIHEILGWRVLSEFHLTFPRAGFGHDERPQSLRFETSFQGTCFFLFLKKEKKIYWIWETFVKFSPKSVMCQELSCFLSRSHTDLLYIVPILVCSPLKQVMYMVNVSDMFRNIILKIQTGCIWLPWHSIFFWKGMYLNGKQFHSSSEKE